MSITGEPERQPQKVGVAVTDIVTGLYGTIGVLAAVEQRHRTGKGQHIDMSLLDCATAMLANQAMNFLATGESLSGAATRTRILRLIRCCPQRMVISFWQLGMTGSFSASATSLIDRTCAIPRISRPTSCGWKTGMC